VDLIYADMLYADLCFDWIDLCVPILKDTGVLYIQTDQRSVCEVKEYTSERLKFQSWIIWGYNWGGRPRRKWGNKHDDIFFFSKSKNWQWFTDAVSIPKRVMLRSSKTHQIPTDVWTDIGIVHTMSKEKDAGRHRLHQKPLALLRRILSAHCKAGDMVVDPFLGTGTTAVVAQELGCDFAGCDLDPEAVDIARERLRDGKDVHSCA
jgi:site-specific DNA-methyltransferase (adenine-specific)